MPGTLARVPLGRREVTGLVWDADFAASDAAAAEPAPRAANARRWCCDPLIEALDALPPLPADWRALVEFAARYYQRSLGEVALAVLPPELRKLDNTAHRQADQEEARPPDARGGRTRRARGRR